MRKGELLRTWDGDTWGKKNCLRLLQRRVSWQEEEGRRSQDVVFEHTHWENANRVSGLFMDILEYPDSGAVGCFVYGYSGISRQWSCGLLTDILEADK